MRGDDAQTGHMFSYLSPDQRVPADHPLRAIRALTDEALRSMSRGFARLYATTGRPSIPPEQLLRALLLQVLYSVRSERLLMEELNYNLLFRWFVGLNMDDPVWHPTTFTKNRDRLLAGEVAAPGSTGCTKLPSGGARTPFDGLKQLRKSEDRLGGWKAAEAVRASGSATGCIGTRESGFKT